MSAAVLSVVPRPLALALGAAAGRLAARFAPARRAVVAANLRHVLPSASEGELDATVRASFSSYGRYWADVAKLGPRDERHVPSRFLVTGQENVDSARQKGALLFALPHLGSWEMGGLWAKRLGFPFVTVAEEAASEELSQWFIARRESLGMRILTLAPDTSAKLVAELRSGGAVALVADRDVVGDGIEVEFFGAVTKVPAGPAVLALRSGASLLPSVVYQDGGKYRAHFSPAIDTTRTGSLREDVQRVTRALLAEFEVAIRRAPEQWHVFQPNWPSDSARTTSERR